MIQFASSSALRLLGDDADALIGVALVALVHPDDAPLAATFVGTALRLPGLSQPVEWRVRRLDGTTVYIEAIASNLLNDESVRGVLVDARDVSERRALLDQLTHQAFHDPLTGLANRALFHDRVRHALALASRQARTIKVLYLDLDDFKRINDAFGHLEGDRLLTMVASRLSACARATDTVARLGGDEFAILVEDATDDATTDRLIERIHEQLAFPFAITGQDVHVSASVGYANAWKVRPTRCCGVPT